LIFCYFGGEVRKLYSVVSGVDAHNSYSAISNERYVSDLLRFRKWFISDKLNSSDYDELFPNNVYLLQFTAS
jgi:hypothetical protein